mmetsp:Transcript_16089/g.25391  ORF Transcript_16089/g.25391 Transcript_16089/m.25391 type:complete len:119 (-) Transcript_16089:723-1079(-)
MIIIIVACLYQQPGHCNDRSLVLAYVKDSNAIIHDDDGLFLLLVQQTTIICNGKNYYYFSSFFMAETTTVLQERKKHNNQQINKYIYCRYIYYITPNKKRSFHHSGKKAVLQLFIGHG